MTPDFLTNFQEERLRLVGMVSAICQRSAEHTGPDLPEMVQLIIDARPPASWEKVRLAMIGTLKICLKRLEG